MRKILFILPLLVLSSCSLKVKTDGSVAMATNEEVAKAKVHSASIRQLEIPGPMRDRQDVVMVRKGYTVAYNSVNKIPDWVAWQLSAKHTDGPYSRQGVEFHEDTDLPSDARSDKWDYYNSGYDKGHMCPAADNKWDAEAMEDCFLFSNMCPQTHNLNAGDWSELEKKCRKWAQYYGSIYIVCGPILYRQNHKKIGPHKVVVPEAFYKVILCMTGTPRAIGFIYKNAKANNPMNVYVNTVDQVERITGIDFFPALEDNLERKIESQADLDDWQ